MLTDCFNISIQSSLNGPVINYEIVRDYAKNTDNDPIEVYRLMKIMLSELTDE